MSWNIKVVGTGETVAAAVNKLDGMPQELKDVLGTIARAGATAHNSSEYNQGVILESCGHFSPDDPWSTFSVNLQRCQFAKSETPPPSPATTREALARGAGDNDETLLRPCAELVTPTPPPQPAQAPTTEPRAVAPTPPPTPQVPPTPPAATQPNLQPANIQPR